MIVLGLTGSIGMGKSTVADMFRKLDIPVYDADAEIHKIYEKGGAAVAPIGRIFPSAINDGAVDRQELGRLVLGDEAAIKKLESITHPLLGQGRQDFFERTRSEGQRIVVLDIPLIFETGGQKNFDKIAVVSAPADVQKQRVLARSDMTEEKFDSILARQVPDAEKRAGADYVIDTGTDPDATFAQVKEIVDILNNA